MKIYIYLTIAILFSSLLSSCVNKTTVVQLENNLDLQVGRHYDQLGPGWKVIFEDEKSITLGRNVTKNCSYTVYIPKSTYRIESWKLTSPRTACDNIPWTGA